MRVLRIAMVAGLMAAFVYMGCQQEPNTPTANSPVTPAPVLENRGGSVDFEGACSDQGSSHRQTLDNDIFYSQTVYRTDWVSAGFGGMRGWTTGTITLAGVTGPVSLALLYWHGPTNSTDPTENASVSFGGNPIVGTNIGFSDDNCWAFDNSQAYVADVTSIVQATGNGAYALANFGTALADNNGASLIVFFNDGDATNNRDVVLFHGNDSNYPNPYDANGWNVTLAGISYTAGTANIQLHVGDGQVWVDDALTLNGDSTFVPGPQIFAGNTVAGNDSGPSNWGNLWDIRTWNVTAYLVPGPNTLTLTTGLNNDCLSLVVALIDLPAGAAPRERVEFDIHPASCPNPLNSNTRSQGVVPAAILGTADFDVRAIDPATIELMGVPPLRWAYEDVATPDHPQAEVCDCNSMGGDGFMDLTLKFSRTDLLAAIGSAHNGDVLRLTVDGFLWDGRAFRGVDCVIMRGDLAMAGR